MQEKRGQKSGFFAVNNTHYFQENKQFHGSTFPGTSVFQANKLLEDGTGVILPLPSRILQCPDARNR